jgi:hypothetical protein
MAKKKAVVKDFPEQAITVDGLDAINIVNANEEEICGWVGDVNFFWFKNGKRNSSGDDAKDLIF